MREIKFKAWDKKRKKIFDIYMIVFDGVNISIKLCNPDGGVSHWFSIEDRFILMQYTGLKDKNGKEIYEGDIVDYGTWDNEDTCERGVIEYVDTAGWYVVQLYSWYGGEGYELLNNDKDELEVIGNIYENPELLRKK